MVVDWLSAEVLPANCMAAGVARGCAQRLARFTLAAPADLRSAALHIAEHHGDGSGRVQPAGSMTDTVVFDTLHGALPADLARALRPNFEWYSCRGAHFHNDAHYDDVLFGAWCIAGPSMEIVFPRTGWRVAIAVGTAVVFDPFEPHGVLLPGSGTYDAARYTDVAPNVFLAFEVALTEPVLSAFGIGAAIDRAPVLSSGRAVNAETGALS